MNLSTEKNQILHDVIHQAIGKFAAQRDKLYIIVKSDESFEIFKKSFNDKIAACIKFQNMMSTSGVNETSIDNVSTAHFNIIVNLIADEISFFAKLIDDFTSSNKQPISDDVSKHVSLLVETKNDLLNMFSYA